MVNPVSCHYEWAFSGPKPSSTRPAPPMLFLTLLRRASRYALHRWRLDPRRELDVIMPLPEEPHGFTSQLRVWVYPGTADPPVHHNQSERQTGAVFPLRVVELHRPTAVRVVACAEVAGILSMHTGNGFYEPKLTLTQVMINLRLLLEGRTGEAAAGPGNHGPKRVFFLIASRLYSRLPHRFYLMWRRVISLGLLPHVRHEHLRRHDPPAATRLSSTLQSSVPILSRSITTSPLGTSTQTATRRTCHVIHDPNVAHAYIGARKSDGVFT